MKRRKSNRLLKDTKTYINLLLFEASGGLVGQVPDGKVYTPPTGIPFNDRRALIDVSLKALAVENKIDPEEATSAWDLMKGIKNDSGTPKSGNTNPFDAIAAPDDDDNTTDAA